MMSTDSVDRPAIDWRRELPALTSRTVVLHEPAPRDLGPLVDLLSVADASRFGLGEPIGEAAVQTFLDRAPRARAAGVAFTYVVTLGSTRAVIGLIQVRALDATFANAEWECTIAPSARGTAAFLEAARLMASFAFGPVGARRLESRVLLQNGRANGALRKLGAVQEGILRRSVCRGGAYLDQVLWSILKDDWGDQWAATAERVH